MSYSLNVSGHISGEDGAKEREQAVVDSLREVVQGLEGVSSATFSGQHLGSVNLLAKSDGGNGTDAPANGDAPAVNNGSLADAPSDGGASSGKGTPDGPT